MVHDVRQRVGLPVAALLALCCVFLLSPLAGCGGDDDDEHSHGNGDHHDLLDGGVRTGATCPTEHSQLTYETFGKPFMTKYCIRCHSTELEGAARNGATPDHDFNLEPGIAAVYDHIDQYAASGPNGTNVVMPPNGDKPTMAEREKLGQWLACDYGMDN